MNAEINEIDTRALLRGMQSRQGMRPIWEQKRSKAESASGEMREIVGGIKLRVEK